MSASCTGADREVLTNGACACRTGYSGTPYLVNPLSAVTGYWGAACTKCSPQIGCAVSSAVCATSSTSLVCNTAQTGFCKSRG